PRGPRFATRRAVWGGRRALRGVARHRTCREGHSINDWQFPHHLRAAGARLEPPPGLSREPSAAKTAATEAEAPGLSPLGGATLWLDQDDVLFYADWRDEFVPLTPIEEDVGRRPQDFVPPPLAEPLAQAIWTARHQGGLIGPVPYTIQLPSG